MPDEPKTKRPGRNDRGENAGEYPLFDPREELPMADDPRGTGPFGPLAPNAEEEPFSTS